MGINISAHAMVAGNSGQNWRQSGSEFPLPLATNGFARKRRAGFKAVQITNEGYGGQREKYTLVTRAAPDIGKCFGLCAQQAGYSQTNLVSNTAGVATTTDPQLLNPWGISVLPGQDFWIANNNSGTSTLYDPQGNKNALVVTIPGAKKNPNGNCSPGCPTGTVANANGSYFSGGSFIFDTEDGIIANWTGASSAVVAFDNSASGAVYKGLALLNSTFLLAANFNSGKIDVYDRNFTPTSLSGSFTDPKLPAGFAPHGIHVIGNQIFVAYAMQDAAKHDAQPGAGVGQVDIFDMNGNFVSTFVAAGGQLNAPWGVVELQPPLERSRTRYWWEILAMARSTHSTLPASLSANSPTLRTTRW